ncbi:MAG: hemolysin III family protein [Alphaproteobacteria bacterium]|nr:hemolysin III family protein [Alphaproteobacteria bacterium]
MAEKQEKIVRAYTGVEELLNSLVHGIGILLSIAGLVILVAIAALRSDAWAVVSCAIFGCSLILMYSMSTIYHAIQNKNVKKYLKKCDHIAIYYLIAGSYTPFLLVLMRGALGWSLFGIIWGLALLGTILKLILPANGTKLWSVGLYLGMGWMVVIASGRLVEVISKTGLTFLILGGLFYTLGIVFYVWKSRKYTHAIWHSFVLLGSIMHFFAVLFGCVLN